MAVELFKDVAGEPVEIDVERYDDGIAVQVAGNDLIWISNISPETGAATVTVFASTAEQAGPVYEGVIDLTGHYDDERDD